MKIFNINENDSGQRVNKFIEKVFKKAPKSLIYKLIRKKDVKLNFKRCSAGSVLQNGDVLQIFGLDDFFEESSKNGSEDVKFNKKLDIVYEDENLIIVNKPSGMKSHADWQGEESLIEIIISYLERTKSYCKELENSFKPALCNRLDLRTSGLILAAKNSKTLREINRLSREGKILKTYLCKAGGIFEKNHEVLVGFWSKSFSERKATVTSSFREGSKKVVTEYSVLEQFFNFANLKVEIYSGRYHQIRAHLASIGHPIVGDFKYGSKFKENDLQLFSCGLVLKSEGSSLDYLSGRRFSIGLKNENLDLNSCSLR